MALPLMRKATAVWLVENTSLTFLQIANFCGLHELEVSGIADGEVASGIRGMDPITSNQLTKKEIKRCELDPNLKLELIVNPATIGETKRRGPRYTPLSKRQDKPTAIAWLVKFYPDLPDSQIIKLVGTTKPTIKSIREKTHASMSTLKPNSPADLGLCTYVELDEAINKALRAKGIDPEARKKEQDAEKAAALSEDKPSEQHSSGFDFSAFMSTSASSNQDSEILLIDLINCDFASSSPASSTSNSVIESINKGNSFFWSFLVARRLILKLLFDNDAVMLVPFDSK